MIILGSAARYRSAAILTTNNTLDMKSYTAHRITKKVVYIQKTSIYMRAAPHLKDTQYLAKITHAQWEEIPLHIC